jgi:hypothetical protein
MINKLGFTGINGYRAICIDEQSKVFALAPVSPRNWRMQAIVRPRNYISTVSEFMWWRGR